MALHVAGVGMSRRKYTIPLTCAEPSCRESSICEAIGLQEYQEARARYGRDPWRCSRHRRPDEVLSLDNPERRGEIVVRTTRYGFPSWSTGSRVVDGPGFKAFSDDFPLGTRLIVTAHIELPESPGSAE